MPLVQEPEHQAHQSGRDDTHNPGGYQLLLVLASGSSTLTREQIVTVLVRILRFTESK
jgi:hypothetical protein